jgi:hypothetical protein
VERRNYMFLPAKYASFGSSEGTCGGSGNFSLVAQPAPTADCTPYWGRYYHSLRLLALAFLLCTSDAISDANVLSLAELLFRRLHDGIGLSCYNFNSTYG